MGNCQATDAATMVIQHPSGKIERFYWPMSASEIMKMNPGHHVALLISTTLYHSQSSNNDHSHGHGVPYKTSNNANVTPVRLTRIKLLRSTDTLLLGHVYRLVTTQEVMKGLSAKKHGKMNKNHQEKAGGGGQRSEHIVQVSSSKHERQRPRSTASSNSAAARSKTWQPKLQSITEATIN